MEDNLSHGTCSRLADLEIRRRSCRKITFSVSYHVHTSQDAEDIVATPSDFIRGTWKNVFQYTKYILSAVLK